MTTVAYPAAPTRDPLVGSLLDTAEVIDNGSIGWLATGEDLWESWSQLTFGSTPVFPCQVSPTKDLSQTRPWVDGFRFGAYGGTTCKAPGQTMTETEAKVREAFSLGESVAIEAAFMATRFRVAAGENVITGVKKWTDPVDITPAGGAVKPKVGIAMIEGWMATRYLGAPTLHLPTTITSLVMGMDGVAAEEQVLRTKLGSKVVNGAGYEIANTSPAGAAAPAGEKWIYGTGEVVVIRSDAVVRQTFDQSTNDVAALAERLYVGAAEGPTVAVRVQVTA